ncbi:MAG: hypothetical protein JW764_02570 [Chlorobiaceae bacterium]|nr:hypothetical protein [Chlorobiaceae bacterium]
MIAMIDAEDFIVAVHGIAVRSPSQAIFDDLFPRNSPALTLTYFPPTGCESGTRPVFSIWNSGFSAN